MQRESMEVDVVIEGPVRQVLRLPVNCCSWRRPVNVS